MKKYMIVTVLIIPFIIPLYAGLLKVDKNITIKKGFRQSVMGTVTVNNSNGAIFVEGWELDSVDIIIEIKMSGNDEEDVDDLLNEMTYNIEKNGNDIIVRTERKKINKWKFFKIVREDVYYSYKIKIRVPVGFTVNTKNKYGRTEIINTDASVQTNNFNGVVFITNTRDTHINNKYGSIIANEINGNLTIAGFDGTIGVNNVQGVVRIDNKYSKIDVGNVKDSLNISSFDGDVDVTNVQSNVTAKIKYADLTISAVKGIVYAENYSGDIDIRNTGGSATVKNKYGSINVKDLGGSLFVSNFSGSIQADNIAGHFKADDKYGSITAINVMNSVIAKNYSGSITLKTIGGSITVNNKYGDVFMEDIIPQIKSNIYEGDIKAKRINSGFADIFIELKYGDVDLSMSKSISAQCVIEAKFGNISIDDIGWRIENDNGNSYTEGILGNGSGKFTVKMMSGDFSIKLNESR